MGGTGNLLVRAAIFLAGAGSFLLGEGFASESSHRSSPRPLRIAATSAPPIVLLTVDTLRADRLGCYGYSAPTSPRLDELAKTSVRYARAISQCSWTKPSMASLMTSRYPSELGVTDVADTLPGAAPTLAEWLSAHDWPTFAVVSNPFVSSKWNFQRGFDSFDQKCALLSIDQPTAERVVDRAVELLQDAEPPFFLWLHFMDPHSNYLDHSVPGLERPAEYHGPVTSGIDFAEYRELSPFFTPEDRTEAERLYASEIHYTDQHIGRLLDFLRDRGWFDPALIVVTADHGEEFLDHGNVGHAGTLYQELVHVPLIVKYPQQHDGVVHEEPVALLDVVPTVMDVVGVEGPERMNGLPLPRTAEGGVLERFVISELDKGKSMRAVFQSRWKLLQTVDGATALHQLDADPSEQVDRSRESPTQLTALLEHLAAWNGECETHRLKASAAGLSEEEIARLEALGYVVDLQHPATKPAGPEPTVERFREAWNGDDLQAFRIFFQETPEDTWQRFLALLDEEGWRKRRPPIRTLSIERTAGKTALATCQLRARNVEVRWKATEQGWLVANFRVVQRQ